MKKISLLCVLCLILAGCTPQSDAVVTPTPLATPVVPSSPVVVPPVEESPVVESVKPVETAHIIDTPAPTTSEPVTVEPVGWDGTLETLTLADFPTELAPSTAVSSAEKPLYLVAELPDQAAWLYCWYGPQKEQGLILRVGDSWQYFALTYLTYRAAPEIAFGDFDGDLDMELALTLPVAAGTGVGIWDLHIVELEEDGLWPAHRFSPDDYTAILNSAVTSTYDPILNAVTLSAEGLTLALPLPIADIGAYQGVLLGQQVHYTVDGDAIRVQFDGCLNAANVGPLTTYFATVSADVLYTGAVFGLGNFSLAPIA